MRIVWQGGALDITERVQIGRADDNDIKIPDPQVSVYHCAIVRQDDDLFLHDLCSTNGTFANGERVKGYVRLQAGDTVQVGARSFTIEQG